MTPSPIPTFSLSHTYTYKLLLNKVHSLSLSLHLSYIASALSLSVSHTHTHTKTYTYARRMSKRLMTAVRNCHLSNDNDFLPAVDTCANNEDQQHVVTWSCITYYLNGPWACRYCWLICFRITMVYIIIICRQATRFMTNNMSKIIRTTARLCITMGLKRNVNNIHHKCNVQQLWCRCSAPVMMLLLLLLLFLLLRVCFVFRSFLSRGCADQDSPFLTQFCTCFCVAFRVCSSYFFSQIVLTFFNFSFYFFELNWRFCSQCDWNFPRFLTRNNQYEFRICSFEMLNVNQVWFDGF